MKVVRLEFESRFTVRYVGRLQGDVDRRTHGRSVNVGQTRLCNIQCRRCDVHYIHGCVGYRHHLGIANSVHYTANERVACE